MDTPKAVTHVSLCAGYGGIDLGLKRAIPSLRTVAFSEIEAFACANLVSKMESGQLDPAPIWTDLKTFPYEEFRDRVDILSGGYPCQPFSAAGKRLGRDDPRHLWPWIADGIALMRPSLCFFENVEGHITLGLRDVLNDLGELGYRTTWGVFSAAEVGAPHQRKRVFILAHKLSAGLEGLLHDITAQGREDERGPATGCSEHRGDAWPSRPGEEQFGWEPPRVVANTKLAVDRSEAGRDQVDQSNAQRPTGWIGGSSQGMGNANRGRDTQSEYQFTNLSTESSGGNEEAMADSKKSGRTDQRVAGELDCEAGSEGSRGNQSAPAAADCGDAGIASDCKSMRLEEQSECLAEREADGSGAREGGCGDNAADGSGEELGDAGISGCDGRSDGTSGWSRESGEAGEDASGWRSESHGMRQTQPPLGRDTDGPSGGMDYAELCVSGDNRTDELRLLGNGVVPATAHKAFVTLLHQLT